MEEAMKMMASVNVEDITDDFRPFCVIHKDGRVQRFIGLHRVPPSTDAETGVESQDVVISPEVWVRLYKPNGTKGSDDHDEKLPVVVYFHGGGFCIETAASPTYHNHLNALAAKANVLVVSVDYRLAPEHPLPAAYDDSWAGLQWVLKSDHDWIKDRGDLSRIFLAGDSAGANIAHQMAKRVGLERGDLSLKGVLLVHPFFWGKERIGSEAEKMVSKSHPGAGMADRLWSFMCPETTGTDDPRINPAMDPELGVVAAEKVLVLVAEHDSLRDRGVHYKEALVRSGCKASAEVVETIGENHVFHLLNPSSPNVGSFMDQVVAFLNSS